MPFFNKRVSQRPQAKAVTLRGEVGAPSENQQLAVSAATATTNNCTRCRAFAPFVGTKGEKEI